MKVKLRPQIEEVTDLYMLNLDLYKNLDKRFDNEVHSKIDTHLKEIEEKLARLELYSKILENGIYVIDGWTNKSKHIKAVLAYIDKKVVIKRADSKAQCSYLNLEDIGISWAFSKDGIKNDK